MYKERVRGDTPEGGGNEYETTKVLRTVIHLSQPRLGYSLTRLMSLPSAFGMATQRLTQLTLFEGYKSL